jgi:hypothetical protein
MGEVLGGDKGDRGGGMGWLIRTYATRGIIVAEIECRKCVEGMVLFGERIAWKC